MSEGKYNYFACCSVLLAQIPICRSIVPPFPILSQVMWSLQISSTLIPPKLYGVRNFIITFSPWHQETHGHPLDPGERPPGGWLDQCGAPGWLCHSSAHSRGDGEPTHQRQNWGIFIRIFWDDDGIAMVKPWPIEIDGLSINSMVDLSMANC